MCSFRTVIFTTRSVINGQVKAFGKSSVRCTTTPTTWTTMDISRSGFQSMPAFPPETAASCSAGHEAVVNLKSFSPRYRTVCGHCIAKAAKLELCVADMGIMSTFLLCRWLTGRPVAPTPLRCVFRASVWRLAVTRWSDLRRGWTSVACVVEAVSAAGRSQAPTTKPRKICFETDSEGRAQVRETWGLQRNWTKCLCFLLWWTMYHGHQFKLWQTGSSTNRGITLRLWIYQMIIK